MEESMHVAQSTFPKSATAHWIFGPVEATLAVSDYGGGGAIAKQRVLLVEDEYFIAAQMEQWLIETGHEVVAIASSAEAAIDVAGKCSRSLFSTAHSDEWTRLQAAPAHPLGWLGKPYGREEFLHCFAQAVIEIEGNR